MMFCFVTFLAVIILPPSINLVNGEWSDPAKAQFHIQTDEGPDRYFKYQTLSGQYRKERRLEDGTVIGSYGWVDDDGYLRMSDYIADNLGYRTLKNKNVFVGKSRPISEALIIAKKAPADSGSLVNSHIRPIAKTTAVPYYSTTAAPYYSTTADPYYSTPAVPVYNGPQSIKTYPSGFSLQHLEQPVLKFGTYTVPQTTASLGYSTPSPNALDGHTPDVEVSLNSISSSTETPLSFRTLALRTLLPPDLPSSTPTPQVVSTTPATVFIPSTTPSHIASYSSTPAYNPAPIRNYEASTSSYEIPSTKYGSPISSTLRQLNPYYKTTSNYISPPISTIEPPYSSNSVDYYSSDPQYEHYPENQNFVNPYIYQNGPTYPIDNRGNSYNGQYNTIGNGYNKQFPLYDGISVTNDGFRYYIPKQYHEEQNLPGNQKSGSFGYVDPFGIRRVIYYNAGPDGFKHRKNNRYVGLNATPYDPRPY